MVETISAVDIHTNNRETIRTRISRLNREDIAQVRDIGEQIQNLLRQNALSHPESDTRLKLRGVKLFENSDYQTEAVYEPISGQLSFYGAPTHAKEEYTLGFLVENFDQVAELI